MTAWGVDQRMVTPLGERPLGKAHNIHDGGGHFISLLGNKECLAASFVFKEEKIETIRPILVTDSEFHIHFL